MAPARQTVAAMAANDVTLGRNHIADIKIAHIGADTYNFADEFMSYNHRHGNRLLRPFIPVVNVQIRPADAGAIYANQHIIDADFRLRHIREPQTALGLLFNQSFHKLSLKPFSLLVKSSEV